MAPIHNSWLFVVVVKVAVSLKTCSFMIVNHHHMVELIIIALFNNSHPPTQEDCLQVGYVIPCVRQKMMEGRGAVVGDANVIPLNSSMSHTTGPFLCQIKIHPASLVEAFLAGVHGMEGTVL